MLKPDPKEWTYLPRPLVEVVPWWVNPLGVLIGLSFCCLWPLWLMAALFAIAPFTGWNPSHKKDG